MSDFRKNVLDFVKQIPRGKVVSYGQVAANCGHPRAARQVGGVLRAQAEGTIVPWWRVVNNKGIISIKGNWTATKELQRSLLVKEGIKVGEEYKLDIERYRLK